MKASTICSIANAIASSYKTLYVMGGIGYRLNSTGKIRSQHNTYNTKAARKAMIDKATDDTWAFDCVCLIKSILWGWNGDSTELYGGANYASNGVPDVNANGMIKLCSNISDDFSLDKIKKGEVVWTSGHVGLYVGNGEVIECTPAWKNCVQKTYLHTCTTIPKGEHVRKWKQHGMMPWVEYEENVDNFTTPQYNNAEKHYAEITDVARQVIIGKYGNGTNRKARLEAAGYNYNEVQARVNELLKGGK